VPSTKSDAWDADAPTLVTNTSDMLSIRIVRAFKGFGIADPVSGTGPDSGSDGA
jgi:hypothetical protein